MNTWPTEPLIHITAGECEGNPIGNALAKHEPHYGTYYPDTYVIATGPHVGEPIDPTVKAPHNMSRTIEHLTPIAPGGRELWSRIMANIANVPGDAVTRRRHPTPDEQARMTAAAPHLRESGNIEQDANVVLLLSCPHENGVTDWTRADIHVAKNREGRTGHVLLEREGDYSRLNHLGWTPRA